MRIFLLAYLVFIISTVAGQEINESWYITPVNRIDFKADAVDTNFSLPIGGNSSGGPVYSLIESDEGSFIGMTNGRTLLGKDQKPTPNGKDIKMSKAYIRQNYFLAPDLGKAQSLYLFTTSCDDDGKLDPPCRIYFSRLEVDSDDNIDVDPNNKNMELTNEDCYPILHIVPGSCGEYWVVTYSYDTKAFLSYHVDTSGISNTPVRSPFDGLDSYNSFVSFGFKMSFAQETNKLYLNTSIYKLSEFNFNRNTGVISDERVVKDYIASNGIITGFDISSEGKYAYVIVDSLLRNSNIKSTALIQEPLDPVSEENSYEINTQSFNQDILGVSRGPDDKIYIGSKINGISRINSPEEYGSKIGFSVNIFPEMNAYFLNYGFPQYINYSKFDQLPSPFPQEIFLCGDSYDVEIEESYKNLKINDQSIQNSIVTFRDTGTYSVYGEMDGCFFEDDVVVYNVKDIDFDIENEVDFCSESVEIGSLNPLEGWTYEWDNNEKTPTIVVSEGGTYTLNIKNSNSECSLSEEISVRKVDPLKVDLGEDRAICTGSVLILDAGVEADTYEWQDGSTNREFEVSEPGTYSVTVMDGDCSSTDMIVITEEAGFDLDLESNVQFCSGDTVSIGGMLNTANSYVWSTGETTAEIKIYEPGTYSVTANNGICTQTGEVMVNVLSLPNIDLGPDQEYCKIEGSITLQNSNSNSSLSYLWDDGSTEPSRTVNTSGLYSVTVDDGTCTNTDEIRIDENPNLCDCRVAFPNVVKKSTLQDFDRLGFLPTCAKQNYRFAVYDRWGNRILLFDDSHSPSAEQIQSVNTGVYVFTFSNNTDFLVPEYGTIVFMD